MSEAPLCFLMAEGVISLRIEAWKKVYYCEVAGGSAVVVLPLVLCFVASAGCLALLG